MSGLRGINLLAALLATAGLLYLAASGAGSLPPLGPAFNPGSGVWTAAADARLPSDGVLRLSGLDRAASVTFERNGTAHVSAATDHDLFFALGYLHALPPVADGPTAPPGRRTSSPTATAPTASTRRYSRAAAVVAGIMGFGAGNGAIVVAVTLLLAVFLSVTGAWVGSAARRLARPRA